MSSSAGATLESNSSTELTDIASNTSASTLPRRVTFATLPAEVIQRIFYFSSTLTFIQLIYLSPRLFGLAAESREVILHHLRYLPGIKLGLSDYCVSTKELFLILRQRAAANLYGVNFSADCRNFSFPNGELPDAHASSLKSEGTHFDLALVLKEDPSIRLNTFARFTRLGSYRETIHSPYADGSVRIIQVVQNLTTVSVLYAWTPPEKDHACPVDDDELVTEGQKNTTKHILARSNSDNDEESKDPSMGEDFTSKPKIRPRYHLLHYDMCTNERPSFYLIPTHMFPRKTLLAPVHLAVYNRLRCAILWDLPDSLAPTKHASVVLYNTFRLPRDEQGTYSVTVIYPVDHEAIVSYSTTSMLAKTQEDRILDDGAGEQQYTETQTGSALSAFDLKLKPRAISFFKDGRRLSLYAPGSVVPYATLSANEIIRRDPRSLPPGEFPTRMSPELRESQLRIHCNEVRNMTATCVNGLRFQLSLPFFAKHGIAFIDVPEEICETNSLCIGTTTIPPHDLDPPVGLPHLAIPGPTVLTIVQIRRRRPRNVCMHIETTDDLPPLPPPPPVRFQSHTTNLNQNPTVTDPSYAGPTYLSLDAMLDHHVIDDHTEARDFGGTDLRVAARLWGWTPQCTTLTGLDTICVSPNGGERIAVAQWDRVLVYALDPKELCEDDGFESEEDEHDSQGGVSSNGSEWEDGDADGDDAGGDNHAAGTTNNSNNTVVDPPSLGAGVADSLGMAQDEDEDEDGGDPSANSDEASQPSSALPIPPISPAAPDPPISSHHSSPPNDPSSDPDLNSTTIPTPRPPSSSTSSRSTSPSRLLNFYPSTQDDRRLGRRVVELRPIVLKMDDGAVVRKMMWGVGRGQGGYDGDGGDDDASTFGWESSDDEEEEEEEETEEDVNGEDSDPESGTQGHHERREEKGSAVENDGVNVREAAATARESVEGEESRVTKVEETSQERETDSKNEEGTPVDGNTIHTATIEIVSEVNRGRKGQTKYATESIPPTNAHASISTSEPPSQESNSTTDAEHKADSEGLTPRSRLQITKTELTDQIKWVQRPPEYGISLDGELEITIVRESVKSDSASESTSVYGDEGKEKEDEVEGVPEGPDEDGLSGATPPELPSVCSKSPSTERPASVTSAGTERPKPKQQPRRRIMQNELVVLTDRGVQVWDLSVWGKGRRIQCQFDNPSAMM